MILRSAVIRLDRLPELILLNIFSYVIAADWTDVFRIGGVSRGFRTFAATYIWPDFKELRISARIVRGCSRFAEITVNGIEMPALCGSGNGPSRQLKRFLECFLRSATRLEMLRLDQDTYIDLVDGARGQGLHQLFTRLNGVRGAAKNIIIAFDVEQSGVYDFHFCNSFAKFIKWTPRVELVTANMLDACQRLARCGTVFPKLETLTLWHFFDGHYQFKWDRIFRGLPNLRELNVSTSWSGIPGAKEYAPKYFLFQARRMFDCFQQAYAVKLEKTRLNFYFERFDRIAPKFFNEDDLPERVMAAMAGEIDRREEGGYTLAINNGNCEIRLTFTVFGVLHWDFDHGGETVFDPDYTH